ncbi:MAG: efflux RND transporter periplasmic adaptor subunit [Thermodesulfobacteriota bacterium]
MNYRGGRFLAPLLLVTVLVLPAGGCARQSGADQPAEGRPVVAVETIRVEPGLIEETVDVVGALAPKYQADIKSEIMGVVREVYVTEWVRVHKGDRLAMLDQREAQATRDKALAAVELAKANIVQAQVAVRRAEIEYNRILKLRRDGVAAQQSLDDVTTERDAAAARLAAAVAQHQVAVQDEQQARTKLDKTVITAPIDGVVAYRGMSVGDMVGEQGSSKIMFRLMDNRLLDLTVTVPSKEMAKVKVGQPLRFTCDAYPGQTFTGRVMYINPSVNETDRTFKVLAEVPNDPEVLKAGLFVKGRIVTDRRENVLLVPRSALLSWDIKEGQAQVWLAQGNKATSRQVRTGGRQADLVEITSGLEAGEQVVTIGAYNLKSGDKIKRAGSQG